MANRIPTTSLKDVIERENAYIRQRRQIALKQFTDQLKPANPANGETQINPTISPPCQQHFSSGDNLIGLALSGGGMRSAIFNLGVVQGLARTGLLPWLDYLSTVSGGGYLGCCLSSLLSMRCIILPAGTEIWPTPDNRADQAQEPHKLSGKTQAEIIGQGWLGISYWPYPVPPETEPQEGWIAEDPAELALWGSQRSYYVWSQPEVQSDIVYLPQGFKLKRITARWLKIWYKPEPSAENSSEGWIWLPGEALEAENSSEGWIGLPGALQPKFKFNTSSNFPFSPELPVFRPKTEAQDHEMRRNHQLYHIRLNGNFIIPRRGPFKSDTLRGVGTVLTGLSHTLVIFLLLFFIIAGLHYVLAGTLAPEIGQKINLIQPPSPQVELRNDLMPLMVEVTKEGVIIDPSLNVQATSTVTSAASKAFDKEKRTLPLDQAWYVLFFSKPPATISDGELRTVTPTLPTTYGWFLGIGLILPIPLFWYWYHANLRLKTHVTSGQGVSAEEWATSRIMQTGILGLIMVFTIMTLVFRFSAPQQTFRLYWLWQPAVFMFGIWVTSTFIYMLYAQHRLWSSDFRSLIAVWQGITIYGLVASILFAILGLPYYITLPNGQGEGSNVVTLLATSLVSTVASYFLANNLSKMGSDGWLNKFFSRLKGLQQGALAVLVVILVLSIILLFATLFDSIPDTAASPVAESAQIWIARLFIALLSTLMVYTVVWYFVRTHKSLSRSKFPTLRESQTPKRRLQTGLERNKMDLLSLSDTLVAGLLVLVCLAIIISWLIWFDRWMLVPIAIGLSILIGLIKFYKWPILEAWLLQTFIIMAILSLLSLIFWLFAGGIHLLNTGLFSDFINVAIFVISILVGIVLLTWFGMRLKDTLWQSAQSVQSAMPSAAGMFIAVLLTLIILGGFFVWGYLKSVASPNDPRWLSVSLITIYSLVLFALICWFSNLNQLSLHYFYRDRLAAAFLRTNIYDNFTGKIIPVRDHSEIGLQDINPPNCSAPYHLIVTALNLSGSKSLTYKDSKSEPFIFSRYFCGSNNTGYRETTIYRGGETKLARALAISGAALSSTLGQYTFFAQAFVMTLLNIRLGYWTDNPSEYDPQHICKQMASNQFIKLNRNSPFTLEPSAFWAKYLWHELSGTAQSSGEKLINLSDGGHTDNLGLYPLLLRRCKLIIVSDAGGDPQYMFDDIARLIRRVSIEENINIDINLEGLRPNPATGLSQHHCAVGTINYPQKTDEGEQVETGWLIYLKATMTDAEHGSVKAYWWTHRDDHFPHQTTVDQFYDDDQFEAYRHLGELTISNMLITWQAFYDQTSKTKPEASLARKFQAKLDQVMVKLLGKTERQAEPLDDLEKMNLMRRILESPAKRILTELSEELTLKEILNDLKTVTTI